MQRLNIESQNGLDRLDDGLDGLPLYCGDFEACLDLHFEHVGVDVSLADDMGVGKTPQCIVLLAESGSHLVVAPKTTLPISTATRRCDARC